MQMNWLDNLKENNYANSTKRNLSNSKKRTCV